MKNVKRILSGLLVLAMVLSLCPAIVFAEETDPADVTINIAEVSNGTITLDKESYKVGDTVELTLAPNGGYFQKLYIDGEPLMLDWKSKTYTFVAEKETYDITGDFVPSLEMYAGDWGRWDNTNHAHGVLTAYYPNNNDSWWNKIKGEYTSISITAKNYREVANSYEGGPDGGWRVVLYMQLDNGKYYAFSMWVNTDKKYAYNHYGGNIDGVASATGWGGAWCLPADKNAEATAALNGDGAEFKLNRIDGNHIEVTLGGTVLETYEIPGVTEANKVVSVGMQHHGNKGAYVDIPFSVSKPAVEVKLPTELENGTVTADKASYQKGDTVTLTVNPDAGYFQKLYINGEPLMLNWKSKTYSFVATEDVYEITGSFVERLEIGANDWGRWDDYNQAHGVLTTYYPNATDSWWSTITGEYEGATFGVKNYLPTADTMDGVDGSKGFAFIVNVIFDNGNAYAFRIYNDKGVYAFANFGSTGLTGWGNWKNINHLAGKIVDEGIDFTIDRTSDNVLTFSVDGVELTTYTMDGITADNKIVSFSIQQNANQGQYVKIPFALKEVNAAASEVIIPEFENGTVTPDKESYKVGETVHLTIAPNAGYAQMLTINGKPVILDWKTNTYSFVATETSYEIAGSFVPALDYVASDANRWDMNNHAHGIMNTYYPDNNDAWWMTFNGNYQTFAVTAKNYKTIAETLDNFGVYLKVTMDNGNAYTFRVFTDKGGYYTYNRAGIQNTGDASADWGNWKNLSSLNDLISGEGAEFKVERTDANILTLSVNGSVVDTYTMNGITAENKVESVAIKHQGNKGAYVAIPYSLEIAPDHVHKPAEAVVENNVDPTCIGVGSYDSVVYCSDCGEEISRVNINVGATGHKPADEAVVENEKAPTCTEAGSYDLVVRCSVCSTKLSSETVTTDPATGIHTYDEGVVTTEPTYEAPGVKTYTCSGCSNTYTEEIPQLELAIELKVTGRSLLLEDIVQIKYYFGFDPAYKDKVTDGGMYVWTNAADAEALNFANAVYLATDKRAEGIYQGNYEYSFRSQGIPAKEMGDTQYVVGYLVIDGVTIYSAVEAYSPKAWAESTMNSTSTSATVLKDKKIAPALMNYGAAAQVRFNYKTDELMNEGFEGFTFTTDMISMTSREKGNGVFKETGISTILVGAVEYKVYYSAEGLEGKSGFGIEYQIGDQPKQIVEGFEYDAQYNEYSVKIEGVPAKHLDEVVTIRPYYTENGEKVYGEVSTVSAMFWVYGAMTSTSTGATATKDRAFAPAFGNYILAANERFPN